MLLHIYFQIDFHTYRTETLKRVETITAQGKEKKDLSISREAFFTTIHLNLNLLNPLF